MHREALRDVQDAISCASPLLGLLVLVPIDEQRRCVLRVGRWSQVLNHGGRQTDAAERLADEQPQLRVGSLEKREETGFSPFVVIELYLMHQRRSLKICYNRHASAKGLTYLRGVHILDAHRVVDVPCTTVRDVG